MFYFYRRKFTVEKNIKKFRIKNLENFFRIIILEIVEFI